MKAWTPTPPPFRKYKKDVYLKNAQTAQFIYQLGELDVIRKKSQEIHIKEITSNATKTKISYLKKCLLKFRKITGVGRGIAAIQVGIPERFSIIYQPAQEEKLLVIINPKIVKSSKKMLRFPEGCMSEGPIYAPVTRPSWIEFEYFDEKGEKQLWNTKDITLSDKVANRVFQHEIDHMDGIIFLDRADMRGLTLESDPSFYDNALFEEV